MLIQTIYRKRKAVMKKQPAVVYSEGFFATMDGKTANGLVRHSQNYEIVAVIDSRYSGRDAGEVLDGKSNGILIYRDLEEVLAKAPKKPKVFIYGIAPLSGDFSQGEIELMEKAMQDGMDIVSGMHTRLADIPGLEDAAKVRGVRLVDVRRPPENLPTATGRKRSGKRLLTVGTDCALGKKYTALALASELRQRGVDADFRASGQTGILIAGSGIPMDSVVADFTAGAAECLSPDAAAEHWDIVEGQGSLFHPAYAGVTLGLVHGSQPDAMVLCHDPHRTHIIAAPDYPTPSLKVSIEQYEQAAQLTNPDSRVVGISFNTSSLSDAERNKLFADTECELGLPCFDPLKTSLEAVIKRILA
jgi:uncharacterized NAD-dependent epimerase/dehydratase family protein